MKQYFNPIDSEYLLGIALKAGSKVDAAWCYLDDKGKTHHFVAEGKTLLLSNGIPLIDFTIADEPLAKELLEYSVPASTNARFFDDDWKNHILLVPHLIRLYSGYEVE